MAKPKITVEGSDDVIRRLKAVIKIVNQELGRINHEAAQRAADRARQLAPYVTGDLFESIEVRGRGTTWRFGSFDYPMPPGRTYAPIPAWVEFGTVRTPAHPYIRPAQEGARASIPTETRRLTRALPAMVKAA